MSNNQKLFEKVTKSIMELFNDSSVSYTKTIENLEGIIDDCNDLITVIENMTIEEDSQ